MERRAEPEGGALGVEKSLGWRVVNFDALKTPPEWLAAAIYAVATFFVLYVIYMIGLGLVAFTHLGHEIAFGSATAGATPPPKSEGGSLLTVFFSVLLALVGGPLVIWRVITSHVQAQAARHQADTAREGHYTDLFTKAVELLGATREVKKAQPDTKNLDALIAIVETEPNLEVRLGAIYALERIAHDSERDHWPIMEVLCAYIRNPQNCRQPIPSPPAKEDRGAWFARMPEARVDVQAALDVIGRRSAERVAYEANRKLKLNFSQANLQRATLAGTFARAVFAGANLECSVFVGTNIEESFFLNAGLFGAVFNGVSLRGAIFSGPDMEPRPLEEVINIIGDDWAIVKP